MTQRTESVCLGRLERAVVKYMINSSFSVFIRQILESIYRPYVCYSCPELYIVLY